MSPPLRAALHGRTLGAIDDKVPKRLPLVDAFIAERLPDGYELPTTGAVLIQHQLGSIVPMTRALLSLGLDPERLHWVDIPYSANADVVAQLVDLGIPAGNFAPGDYNLEKPYAPYQHRRVAQLIAALRDELGPGDRLLVLDDGAYFAEAASCFAAELPRVALVEQTRRGMMKILGDPSCRSYAETTRFVNVAEAPPKLEVESRFIAQAVLRALQTALGPYRATVEQGETLLLGYGAIGRQVAHALVDWFDLPRSAVHVHDPSSDALAAAQRDGFGTWNRTASPFTRYRLVLGCSGKTSFRVGDRVFLADDAILASTSSGAAELSREQFIELADAHSADDVFVYDRETLATRSLHSTIRLRLVDRDASFLNGGFPINFDGNVNCVPPAEIQLTRALMLAAAVQALEAERDGIEPLAPETCDWLVGRFRELTAPE